VRALGVFVAVCLTVTLAHADGAAEKVKAGEELAKQSRWTEAIESFKAADKISPRASHACLIALAYIRRELWPQAEVFLNLCHQRATASDPVPDWVQLAETQLRERLANQKVAPVNIRIVPETLAKRAMFSVSSWAPDELFSPTTIHLPRGKHLITATVDGRPAIEQQIEITDNAPREIILDFDHRSEDKPVRPLMVHGARRSKLAPNVITGIGGAALIGGVAYHLLAFKKTRDDLAAATAAGDTAAYDALSDRFDARRRNTILLYGAGTVLVATGIVLRYTLFHDPEAPVAALAVTPGGAVATVEWHR
jgi:hypothetical protein